jgi:hypothetical protein
MKWTLIPVAIAAMALGTACRTATPPVVASAPVVLDSAATWWITMERGPCFGTCPVYALRIAATGDVEYEGRRFVETMGLAHDRIPADELASFRAAVARIDFGAIAPLYIDGEAACAQYVTDMPSAVVTITSGASTKTIRHDFGCGGAPPALRAFEASIDSVTHVTRWTRGAGGQNR